MKKRAMMAAAALLAALWLLVGVCAAEGTVMLAEVGYDGTLLCGEWIPLEVEITSQTALSGMLSAQVYQESERYDTVQTPVELAAGETVRVHLPILPLVPQRRFDVTLTIDGQPSAHTAAKAAREVDSGAVVIGVLGDPTGELTDALRVTPSRDPLKRDDLIDTVALSAQVFPRDEREMAAFDVIVLNAFDAATLDEAQQALLKNWLLSGGTIIAGAGDGQTHSLAWLSEQTGVRVEAQTPAIGALDAVLAYAGMASGETDAASQAAQGGESEADDALGAMTRIYPLSVSGGALAEVGGVCLLAESQCGEGLALTAGFSLTHPQAIEAAKDALWQRVLIEADPQRYNAMVNNRYNAGNTRFSHGITGTLRVSVGTSMLSVAAMLAAYVLLAGTGLYWVMKRCDRSKALWALIPLSSVACVALVAVLSAALGLNRPAATSLTIAEYDEAGEVETEEYVALAYPQQTRVRIEAQSGNRIERVTGWYYRSYSEIDDQTEERDRITLGDQPALELPEHAPWLEQNLVILDTSAPDGRVTGRAWMEEDGLHATFQNDTNETLQGAVMLSELGYVALGDIAPGESADAFLAKNDGPIDRTDSGEERILPGKLLASSQSLYRTSTAAAYFEREMDSSFDNASLSKEERYRRSILDEMLTLSQNSAGAMAQDKVHCVLVAQSDALTATALTLDAKPIDRTEHMGVVLARAAFETVGPTGVIYYPESAFPAHKATLSADGTPSISDETERYYVTLSGDTAFGFALEGVDAAKVTGIRVVHSENDSAWKQIEMSVYDRASGEWTPLEYGMLIAIDGELARRSLGETGELFLRYSAAGDRTDLSVPQIIVEGSEAI